jgi:PhzF family phenazine biosynthesis protein
MPIPLYQVDSFTTEPFRGNPAGVCLLDSPRDDAWMQAIAAEMNLAETAFLLPESDGFRLRWFTPTVEVDLCGHATLASAHILWESGRLKSHQEPKFFTRSGLLSARLKDGLIVLDFPVSLVEEAEPPTGLDRALGVQPIFIGSTPFDWLIEVESDVIVRQCKPNMEGLRQLAMRGAIVTSRSESSKYDFVSRFFAPGAGIPEDPVTGSAHCALGPFWGKRLGKTKLTGYQASVRGGIVKVELNGDRVLLGGRAVTVFKADLFV